MDTWEKILAATSSAYQATLADRTAKTNAKATQAAANAQVASSSNLVRFGLIGGGLLALVVIVIFIFKRK